MIGDYHNLFGIVDEAHVAVGPGKQVKILATQPGDRAQDVLKLFAYDPAQMVRSIEVQAKEAVREKRITKAQAAVSVNEYRAALEAYTYLDFEGE